MSTESSSPEGDTEDVSDPYGRLTVSAFGPVVQEQERDGGVVVATETQAQVERRVRDADDLSTLVMDSDPGKAAKAVGALIEDVDDLRLPQDEGRYYNFAADWNVQVEGDVADWLALADEEKDARGLANRNDALDVLERLTRDDRNVGPNAYLAALSLAADVDADRHGEILERYRERFGPDQDDDGDSDS